MALFSRTKKTDAPKAATKEKKTSSGSVSARDLSYVLRHARITEKATMHSAQGVYVFDVSERANKHDIAAAVKKLYNVTPRLVRIATVPAKTKRSMRTGKVGTKKGGKKAYVYLKSGESITIS